MRIQILGTAAAEGWPAVFCGCKTCNRARAAGGKDFRTRQSVQIDDIIKIDLPPDTHYHQFHYGIDLSQLKHLFITHSHGDHLAIRQVDLLRPPFAHNLKCGTVHIYGNPTVVSRIDSLESRKSLPVETVTLQPFVPIQADHLTFTPIPGRHKPDEMCLTYVVQSETATVLFAWDTGLYDQESMDHLSRYKFDLIIMECTQGTQRIPSRSHMGLNGVIKTKRALTKSGAITPKTRFIITHFSHNIGLLHDELSRIAARAGIEVAYDGLVLEC